MPSPTNSNTELDNKIIRILKNYLSNNPESQYRELAFNTGNIGYDICKFHDNIWINEQDHNLFCLLESVRLYPDDLINTINDMRGFNSQDPDFTYNKEEVLDAAIKEIKYRMAQERAFKKSRIKKNISLCHNILSQVKNLKTSTTDFSYILKNEEQTSVIFADYDRISDKDRLIEDLSYCDESWLLSCPVNAPIKLLKENSNIERLSEHFNKRKNEQRFLIYSEKFKKEKK